jgi:hypothetical protein
MQAFVSGICRGKKGIKLKIKTILFTAVFIASSAFLIFAFDQFLDGGPARLASMGNQEIVVEDNSTIIDLNDLGFSSGIFTRPSRSVLYFNPELDAVADGGGGGLEYLGAGNGTAGAQNNGILLFFSKDTAMSFKPTLSLLNSQVRYTGGGSGTFTYYIPAGEISIAQKFGDNFSAAVSGGYLRWGYNQKMTGVASTGVNDYYFQKVEYDISLAILPANADGWSFAVSAGNKTSPVLKPLSELDQDMVSPDMMAMIAPMEFFDMHRYVSDGNLKEYYEDEYLGGNSVLIGVSSGRSGDIQIGAKAGLLLGLASKQELQVVPVDPYSFSYNTWEPIISYGTGFNSELDLRVKTGLADLGLKGVFDFAQGNTDFAGINQTRLNCKGVAGLNIKGNGFILPVELFYEAIQLGQESMSEWRYKYSYGAYDFGLRLGSEVNLNEKISVRAGADYTMEALNWSDRYGYDATGITTLPGPPAGTAANPWFIQAGFNAGGGYKDGSSEFNLALRVEPQWNKPYQADYIVYTYTRVNFKLIADMKFFL